MNPDFAERAVSQHCVAANSNDTSSSQENKLTLLMIECLVKSKICQRVKPSKRFIITKYSYISKNKKCREWRPRASKSKHPLSD